MMKFLRSICIFGFLLISLGGATGANTLKYFPKRFTVATSPDSVTLPCDVASKGDEVTWKFRGEEIDDDQDDMKKIGPNLLLQNVEKPMLGEYTCWSRGKSMSTYLLLQAEEEKKVDSFLNCTANSYGCTLSCIWNYTEYELVRLGLGPHCREGGDLCSWVSSTIDKQDGTLHFELRHSLSPYSEESTMLEITAEAIENDSFLRRIKKFYLRDIIKPDSPIVKCQELEHYLSVTVQPPCSWSSPDSFFPLEHQVEYQLRDDGQVKRSKHFQLPKKTSSLRARSRDLLVQSDWSEWSEWTNVQQGKMKLCKPKKTVIYCYPQRHSICRRLPVKKNRTQQRPEKKNGTL